MKKEKRTIVSFDEFVEYYRRLIQESGGTTEIEANNFLNFKAAEAFSKRLQQDSKKNNSSGSEKAIKLKDIRGKAKMIMKMKKKKNCVKPKSLQKKQRKKGIFDFKKVGLDPPPAISASLKRKIEEKRGVDVKLVIMKQVTMTDLSSHHNRLTIPVNQVKSKRDDYFLTEEELMKVSNKEHIKVMVIEPCGYENAGMGFTRWKLKSSFSYVLVTKWNDVLERKLLKVNDIIQVWSFRVDTQLWFAVDKIWDAPSTSSS